MQRDVNDLKKLNIGTHEIRQCNKDVQEEHSTIIEEMHNDTQSSEKTLANLSDSSYVAPVKNVEVLNISEGVSDNYSQPTEENDNYTYAEDIEEEEIYPYKKKNWN